MMLETKRLIIRELEMNDAKDLFEMESTPEVHEFIEKKPIKSLEKIYEIIKRINKHFSKYGVGRLAVIDKKTNKCIGWCGLRFFEEEINGEKEFYELGYRFNKKYWGKGYATEAARAIIEFSESNLGIKEIYATIDPANEGSEKVLKKLDFVFIENFNYEGNLTGWFKLKRVL